MPISACVRAMGNVPVAVGTVISSMPESSGSMAGHGESIPARELSVSISKEVVRRSHDQSLTLALWFDDCAGHEFWGMDIFVEGQSLYQSRLTAEAFQEMYDRLPAVVPAKSYIYEDLYQKQGEICVRVQGGNMLGQMVRSETSRIK